MPEIVPIDSDPVLYLACICPLQPQRDLKRFATASLSIVPSPSVTKSAAYLVFSKQAALRLEQ